MPGMQKQRSACRSTKPIGTMPSVWRKSCAPAGTGRSGSNHKVRAVLGARAQLVGTRTDIRNQIRGLLKVFGVVLEQGGDKSFEARVSQVARGNGDVLELSLQTLMATLKVVREQVEKLDRMAEVDPGFGTGGSIGVVAVPSC